MFSLLGEVHISSETAIRKHFETAKVIMVDNPQFALSLAIADTIYSE
ncbi:plasmid segregation protein ParM [Serratia nevei]|nr:plasmid segregation protein ParM [Serratia nevei]